MGTLFFCLTRVTGSNLTSSSKKVNINRKQQPGIEVTSNYYITKWDDLKQNTELITTIFNKQTVMKIILTNNLTQARIEMSPYDKPIRKHR
jgi:hypothetical protein